MQSRFHASRSALSTRTNTLDTRGPLAQSFLTSFLPKQASLKRDHGIDNGRPAKRLKTESSSKSEESDSEYESESCSDTEFSYVPRDRRDVHAFLHTRPQQRQHPPGTLPILKSFVSSHKADVFKCQSIGDDTYLTPPYCCSYSHASKRGSATLLAVATEQGSVHILNTEKRTDWDREPQRQTFQPHHNGIFDIKWSPDDKHLATCSGDQSIRLTDVETGVITHVLHGVKGHNSTVKCMTWDPSHESLCASGGRDGTICLWDLRVTTKRRSGDLELSAADPVLAIYGAHEELTDKSRPRTKKVQSHSAPRTITSLLYPDWQPYGLVSAASFDGILNYWDLRSMSSPSPRKNAKRQLPTTLYSSPIDPTLEVSKRPRGIISMASGTGPTGGLIFAIGTDARIHTYDLPTLTARRQSFKHDNLQISFWVGLSASPCGRWLACGGSGSGGRCFMFDVSDAGRTSGTVRDGVELRGQNGEVGSVSWNHNSLATCADDGTVRVWRPDVETYNQCLEHPEDSKWDWSWSQ